MNSKFLTNFGTFVYDYFFQYSDCFHIVRALGHRTEVYIYLSDCLTGGVGMGMSQKKKKEKFPQLNRQRDSVFGHMSDISSN